MQERFEGEDRYAYYRHHLWTNLVLLWHINVPTYPPYPVNLFRLYILIVFKVLYFVHSYLGMSWAAYHKCRGGDNLLRWACQYVKVNSCHS